MALRHFFEARDRLLSRQVSRHFVAWIPVLASGQLPQDRFLPVDATRIMTIVQPCASSGLPPVLSVWHPDFDPGTLKLATGMREQCELRCSLSNDQHVGLFLAYCGTRNRDQNQPWKDKSRWLAAATMAMDVLGQWDASADGLWPSPVVAGPRRSLHRAQVDWLWEDASTVVGRLDAICAQRALPSFGWDVLLPSSAELDPIVRIAAFEAIRAVTGTTGPAYAEWAATTSDAEWESFRDDVILELLGDNEKASMLRQEYSRRLGLYVSAADDDDEWQFVFDDLRRNYDPFPLPGVLGPFTAQRDFTVVGDHCFLDFTHAMRGAAEDSYWFNSNRTRGRRNTRHAVDHSYA